MSAFGTPPFDLVVQVDDKVVGHALPRGFELGRDTERVGEIEHLPEFVAVGSFGTLFVIFEVKGL